MKLYLPRISRIVAFLLAGILVAVALPSLARDGRSPSSRWVELKQIRGTVIYQGRSARIGDGLRKAGEQFSTAGKGSSAALAIDNRIGKINVSSNSTLRAKNLSIAANGGRVTDLLVPKGQARLSLRRFNNRSSRLQVSTPTGIAGVRGTDFGVAVGPKGKTGISTLEGAVAASGQGQTVIIKGGYSSLIFPGNPPTPPQLTKENLAYNLQRLSKVGNDKVQIIARVDPLNIAFLNDQPLEISRDGKINAVLPVSGDFPLILLVRTPLGNEQSYKLGTELLR